MNKKKIRKIALRLVVIVFFASIVFAENVKKADLAGTWYTGSGQALENELKGYLAGASPEKVDGRIFAVISPHAGYRYSGPIAAYSFKAAQTTNPKTVIVIGFAHRRSFNGISIYERGNFRTPLGDIQIDEELARDIAAKNKSMRFYPEAFSEENSIEMQIPFIQAAFKGAKIVPIAFGGQSLGDASILADALAKVLKDRNDYLIVASTDLSHYHPYEEANAIDRHLINTLNKMKAVELYDEAGMKICELCGVMPVTATLLAAEKLGFDRIKVLRYANSGDTAGAKESVVGYLSAAIYREEKKDERGAPMLNDAQRKKLLAIARESITSFVRDGKRKSFTESDPVLNQEMGAFVTLHESGELRGCIGNMAGHGPLYRTVADMAIEAATGDPRFSTLSPAEIDKIDIEISVLSPLKKVASYKEVEIPGHGVVVRSGYRSGVYLPQVADETGWSRDEFLTSLCSHKAGLSPDAWKDPSTEILVFSAEVFGEK
ncbi:MAG: AmmeMemoRadiSam system protein B [Candidatus Omnitrophota bacterium]